MCRSLFWIEISRTGTILIQHDTSHAWPRNSRYFICFTVRFAHVVVSSINFCILCRFTPNDALCNRALAFLVAFVLTSFVHPSLATGISVGLVLFTVCMLLLWCVRAGWAKEAKEKEDNDGEPSTQRADFWAPFKRTLSWGRTRPIPEINVEMQPV